MAANPLTYSELEAFERKTLVRLTAWETDLIMRLDDEVLAVWNEQRPKSGSNTVSMKDGKAVRDLVRGAARTKSQKGR